MKETVYAIVYERFYKKLRNKFYKEFFPSNSNIPEGSKDVWKRSYKDLDTNIAKDLFGINNEFYFHRKYDEKAKEHMEYGYPLYPITVDRKQFSLALKYLLFGRVEKIDEFPELDFGVSAKWDANYSTLLSLFMEQEFPNGIEEKKDEKHTKDRRIDDEAENIFLNLVTTNGQVFNPIVIRKVILDFFSFLNTKDFHSAWNLLAPSLQKYSIWDGNYHDFANTFHQTKSVVIEDVDKRWCFKFGFKSAFCRIIYRERGALYNIPLYVEKAREENNPFKPIHMFIAHMEEYIHEKRKHGYYYNHINWLKNYDKKLLDMNKEELLDVNFQKAIQFFFLDNPRFSELLGKYKATIAVNITCEYIHDKWLISELNSSLISTEVL